MLYGLGVFVLFIGGKFIYERYSVEGPTMGTTVGSPYQPTSSQEMTPTGDQEEVTKKIIERVRLGEEVFDDDDDL